MLGDSDDDSGLKILTQTPPHLRLNKSYSILKKKQQYDAAIFLTVSKWVIRQYSTSLHLMRMEAVAVIVNPLHVVGITDSEFTDSHKTTAIALNLSQIGTLIRRNSITK